jgi:hypothetical protein
VCSRGVFPIQSPFNNEKAAPVPFSGLLVRLFRLLA